MIDAGHSGAKATWQDKVGANSENGDRYDGDREGDHDDD